MRMLQWHSHSIKKVRLALSEGSSPDRGILSVHVASL